MSVYVFLLKKATFVMPCARVIFKKSFYSEEFKFKNGKSKEKIHLE